MVSEGINEHDDMAPSTTPTWSTAEGQAMNWTQ